MFDSQHCRLFSIHTSHQKPIPRLLETLPLRSLWSLEASVLVSTGDISSALSKSGTSIRTDSLLFYSIQPSVQIHSHYTRMNAT